jgi:hypothetical protein
MASSGEKPDHGDRLPRARRERPRSIRGGRRAAEQRDELASLHSITLLARASGVDTESFLGMLFIA